MITHRTAATQSRHAIVVFALALLPLVPGALHAQAQGGSAVATAEILPPAVTGTGFQELKFGTVAPGDAVDVPPAPAGTGATTSAAGWHFGNIRKGRWVSLNLVLPPALTRGLSVIPVDWNNANYARICVSGSSGVCNIDGTFNPGAQPSIFFRLNNSLPGNNFDVRLFVGARLTVPANPPPGRYTATVVATFAYVT